MNFIDDKGQKLELRSSRNVLTNHMKFKSHHWLFMASGLDTHTHAHIHTLLHESNFKKIGK